MTRASNLILRVRITGGEVDPPANDNFKMPYYPGRLVETIHGMSPFKSDGGIRINAEWDLGKRKLSLKPGSELILLGAYVDDFDSQMVAEPSICGAIPATEENLAQVRRAAKDIPPAPLEQQ